MKEKLKRCVTYYFGRDLEINIRLFNALGVVGGILSFGIGIVNIFGKISIVGGLLCVFVAVPFTFGIIYYARKSRNYSICYIITIIIVFIVLYGMMFFSGGGYHSGMPVFFVFSITFTFLMLEGKLQFFFVMLEIVFYVAICVIAYVDSRVVTPLESELVKLLDVVGAFTVVSLAIGGALYAYMNIYKVQQVKLEEARKEAERLNQVKSDFLAHISHEIRTPINVMNGMAEMIWRESEGEQIAEYAQNARNAGDYLLSLINNILDFTRMETQKLEIKAQPYRTESFLNDLYSLSVINSKKEDVSFEMIVGKNMPGKLFGDELQIKQVIMNLIGNALKYTVEGRVMLEIEVEPGSDQTCLLKVTVTDTGIGIKEEDLARLFLPFERIEEMKNRLTEGSGLGLAIAKRLTDMMDGTIQVLSTYGKGSIFKVAIPQGIIREESLEEQNYFNTNFIGERCHMKHTQTSFIAPEAEVLVIDDNEMNLQVIQSLLKRTRVKVDLGRSGEECLTKISEKRYDVIFLDYMMPIMDGIATLHKMPETYRANTTVIALTAYSLVEAENMFLNEGFTDYLSKPVEPIHLEEMLLKYLPKEMVTLMEVMKRMEIPDDVRDAYEELLQTYDVSLEEGLSWCNEDLHWYAKTLGHFCSNYRRNRDEVLRFCKEEQWVQLKSKIHALKGNAKNIGASELFQLARRLEKHCKEGDYEYVCNALELLLFEWRRVFFGAEAFLEQLDKKYNEVGQASVGGMGSVLRKVLDCLDKSEYEPAIRLFDRLKGGDIIDGQIGELEKIRELIEELEYEEAEMKIKEFIQAEALDCER